jgi:arylsulfatase A-like enzyme
MVDLVPTFLEIGQASQPEGVLVGSSLLPLLLEKAGEEDRPSLTESPGNCFLAYRSEGWKLIWNTESNERFLFDLATDPGERQNVVEEQPQRAEKMATILEEHLRMVKADGTLGAGKRQELALDADLLEQLRNLGYVE